MGDVLPTLTMAGQKGEAMTKIGEIHPAGAAALRIIYDDKTETNPYRVYQEWFEPGPYGLMKRRKLVIMCADLLSCMIFLTHYVEVHNEERR